MARALTPADRRRVFRALDEWCSAATVVALRTRALVALAADSGLRVNECRRLDLVQLLSDPRAETIKIAPRVWLRPSQAKGGTRGAGYFQVSERARRALRAYIRALRSRGWIEWPPSKAVPLFLGHRLRQGRPGHARLSVRAAQWSWYQVQARARLSTRYGFHCLRHDSLTRLRDAGGDALDLKAHGRFRSLSHIATYVHEADAARRSAELITRAARL